MRSFYNWKRNNWTILFCLIQQSLSVESFSLNPFFRQNSYLTTASTKISAVKSILKTATPISTRVAPFSTRVAPFSTRVAPFSTRVAPFSTRVAPISTRVAPISTRVAPISTRVTPNSISSTRFFSTSTSSNMISESIFSRYPLGKEAEVGNIADVRLVPMLKDNYGFLLVSSAIEESKEDFSTSLSSSPNRHDDTTIPPRHYTLVVDPGDGKAILNACQKQGLVIDMILCTHKHADHVGGVEFLLEHFPSAKVYGPMHDSIPQVTYPLEDRTIISYHEFQIHVWHLPCHTRGHLGYLVYPRSMKYDPSKSISNIGNGNGNGNLSSFSSSSSSSSGSSSASSSASSSSKSISPILFIGDTIFVGGVGRFFEGCAEEMLHNIQRISRLPLTTKIYCAHEYTQSNFQFLLHIMKEFHLNLPNCMNFHEFGWLNNGPYQHNNEMLRNEILDEANEMNQMMISSSSNGNVIENVTENDYILQMRYIQSLQDEGEFTVPTTLQHELRYNLFFKCHLEQLQNALGVENAIDAMKELRHRKNHF